MQIPLLLSLIVLSPFFQWQWVAWAGCQPVGSGEGDDPLHCPAYGLPTAIGQTSNPAGVLTIERLSMTGYAFTNDMYDFDAHFIVQFYDAEGNVVRW